MKKNVFALLAVLLLMGSTAFGQDGGSVDSVKMTVISGALTLGLPSQPLVVACSAFVDVDQLSTLQFAFKWNSPDLVLDSADTAGTSAQFKAMDIGPFYYLDNSLQTSNDSNVALLSGTSIFTNFPSSASWQFLADFHFTVLNWSAGSGAIVIDTSERAEYASTEYIFLPAGGSPYDPVWKGPITITSSAVNESDLSNIPNSFELEQNFPNPFNPTTKIKFGLPTKSHVRLTVYNLLGQEIVTLVDEELSAGTHTTEWDGRDRSQTEVASGIYFYKLIAADFVDTKKMMLIK
jgi:hypothetical protein